MNKITKILLLLLFVLTFGCEDVTVVSPELNYKEFIVVRAELVANEDFQGVKFYKTQPINQKYDSTTNAITNVKAYIKVGGIQVVPLYHAGNGVYKPVARMKIYADSTYELFAKINDVSIYSITRVPEKPVITSASFFQNTYIQASINARPNESYGAAWEIYNSATGNVIDNAPDFREVVQNPNLYGTTSITVKTLDLPDKYKTGNYDYLRYVRVYAYDSSYLKYFKTRNNNQPVSDVFSQGGDQIVWNVQGDNVIGLFMGSAPGDFIKVQ